MYPGSAGSADPQMRDKKWFLVKRRKSINATKSDVRQKKPITANRRRFEAAFATLRQTMPRNYAESRVIVVKEELEKYPVDEEREMLEQVEAEADLNGEVRLDRSVFSEWITLGQANPTQCPCAVALMRYAFDQQGQEIRGAVTGETA